MTFNQFWEAYDYKVGRKKAEKAWKRLNELNKMAIANHLPRYVASTYKDGTYPSRKHPSTYLNQESWNDEITEIKPRNARGVSQNTERRIKDLFGPEPGRTNPQDVGGAFCPKEIGYDDIEEDIKPETVLHRRIEPKDYRGYYPARIDLFD
jgi:hypothetical protein